jgi:hypothetical protein
MKERPFVPMCKTEDDFDKHFEKLLDQYPVPDGYDVTNGGNQIQNTGVLEPLKPIKVL